MEDKDKPLISIVMPTYNHGKFISRAITSIRNQIYESWEIIIVDNHSEDDTDDIILAAADKRIKYIKFKNNGIIAASRNIGINAAKGQWIAFLDSDDWWTEDKLKYFDQLNKKNIDVFYHNLTIVDEKGAPINKYIKGWVLRKPIKRDLLVRGNPIATSSVIVRREILGKTRLFDENPKMVACEDYNLWLQIAEVTDKFYLCNRLMGYYTSHKGGASNRNTSVSEESAVKEYLASLSVIDRRRVSARIRYLNMRYQYRTKKYENVIKEIKYINLFGSLSYGLKTIAHIFLAAYKILNNKERA